MTEIREISAGDVARNPRSDELPKNNPSMPMTVLFVASLILSVMNGLGLIYAVSIVDKLSDVSDKVARIDDFEGRISRQLAVFNDGIHSQFDKLDSQLIASGVAGNSFEFRTMRNPRRLLAPAKAENGLLSAMSAEFRYTDQQAGDAASPFAAGHGGFVPASEQVTSAGTVAGFSRAVTADGKIIYRKIR